MQELDVFFVGGNLSEVGGRVFGFVGGEEKESLLLGQDLFDEDRDKLILHQDSVLFWVFVIEVEHDAQHQRQRTWEEGLEVVWVTIDDRKNPVEGLEEEPDHFEYLIQVLPAGRDENDLLFGHHVVQDFWYLEETKLFYEHLKALLFDLPHVLLRVDFETDGADFGLDVDFDGVVVDVRAMGLGIVKNILHKFGQDADSQVFWDLHFFGDVLVRFQDLNLDLF